MIIFFISIVLWNFQLHSCPHNSSQIFDSNKWLEIIDLLLGIARFGHEIENALPNCTDYRRNLPIWWIWKSSLDGTELCGICGGYAYDISPECCQYSGDRGSNPHRCNCYCVSEWISVFSGIIVFLAFYSFVSETFFCVLQDIFEKHRSIRLKWSSLDLWGSFDLFWIHFVKGSWILQNTCAHTIFFFCFSYLMELL